MTPPRDRLLNLSNLVSSGAVRGAGQGGRPPTIPPLGAGQGGRPPKIPPLGAGLRLALTLLTAIPVPGQPRAPDRRAVTAAMYWAPLVGLLVGLVSAGVLQLADRLAHTGPLLAAALAVAAAACLTRGLHLDGLADLADGLGSRRPASEALAVMKQSDIGPFGVVTLVFVVLLQVSALARALALGRGSIAVVAAAVTGRLAITLACSRGIPAARPAGLGALVAGSVRKMPAAALALAALAAAAAVGWIYAIAMAAGLAASTAAMRLAARRLGGITGDVLGAIAEVAATACLIATAVRF
jgi:adenosylcobinamide-GDP ribazoletransferase